MKWIILIALFILIFVIFRRKQQRREPTDHLNYIPEEKIHTLLTDHVRFYTKLTAPEQLVFRKRVQHFLDHIKITAVGNTTLTTLDRLYIAASAIIPIFHFKDWAYNNLNEILVYPDAFTHNFETDNPNRNIGGMVGNGALHRMMILSQRSLRDGFEKDTASNTALHEFIHLIDKADGATDGIPEYMIPKDLVKPWMDYMYQTIQAIRNQESELNPYAGTNEAEFFAVLSEYFFQKPGFLKEHHPELFHILEQTYGIRKEEE